ncbi:MAG TPA: hypothetical protein GXX18_06270 [Bacillales bacterium]|nr:hypothetical protein [Bacillales bacterium]
MLGVLIGINVSIVLIIVYFLLPSSKKYVAAEALQKVNPQEVEIKSTFHQTLGFINKSIAKKYLKNAKEKIQKEIGDAGIKQTPEHIVIEQFSYPIITLIIAIGFYFLLHSIMVLLIGGGVAVYLIFEPRAKLKKLAKKRKETIREQTPNFVLTCNLLLKGGLIPVDALKLSCEYASTDALKPFTDQLKEDLNHLHPVDAIRTFAKSTKVPEMIEFSATLIQFMDLGPTEEGLENLKQMEETFRELNKKVLAQEVVRRPQKIKVANWIIGLDGMALIISAIAMYFVQMMSGGIH